MVRAKLRARVCSCGKSIPVLKSGVWSDGIREMLSLSNCINTRTRTKLSEVRNVTIFLDSCAHTLSKGKRFKSWDVGATYTAKRRALNSGGVSTAEVFLLRCESHWKLKHFFRGKSSRKFWDTLLTQTHCFLSWVVANGNPSSVFYNKIQQKFIVLDAATTVFGRMGHISVKYIPCSSAPCSAQTEKRHFNERIKIACWVAGCVLQHAKFCLAIIQAEWENTTLSIEGAQTH